VRGDHPKRVVALARAVLFLSREASVVLVLRENGGRPDCRPGWYGACVMRRKSLAGFYLPGPVSSDGFPDFPSMGTNFLPLGRIFRHFKAYGSFIAAGSPSCCQPGVRLVRCARDEDENADATGFYLLELASSDRFLDLQGSAPAASVLVLENFGDLSRFFRGICRAFWHRRLPFIARSRGLSVRRDAEFNWSIDFSLSIAIAARPF